MRKPRLHTILFVVLMTILCLPMVQQMSHVFKLKQLDGFTAPVEPVKLSWESFRNQSYQQYVQQYLQQNFGFRNSYIRTYNQFIYTCFHQTTNDNIVIGKQDELYLKQYTDVYTGQTIRNHYGTEDSARAAMRQNVKETLRIIDTLKQFGTDIIVVLAPSKPLIYPEYLPYNIQKGHHPFSIQEEYARFYEQAGVEHINFVPIFRDLKKTAPYPVYTRYGTHWAHSTIPFVADTILQKIASVKGYPMPHIVYADSNLTTHYRNSDKEVESQLNLLFPLRHEQIPMPIFTLTGNGNSRKPNLLVVGDSYYTQLENTDFTKAFGQVDYWKYNETAYSSQPERCGKISHLKRYETITEADVILVIFTDMHAYSYFFGFLNTVEQALKDGPDFNEIDREEVIQDIITRIKASPEWYEEVKKQAKKKKIDLDQCLRNNAEWVFEQEHK
ncbi:MAG: hypothetical protein J5741_07840 [Bacteroidales bacterium]|nr:hypothetical protein [Bacteroidales bacterium]